MFLESISKVVVSIWVVGIDVYCLLEEWNAFFVLALLASLINFFPIFLRCDTSGGGVP